MTSTLRSSDPPDTQAEIVADQNTHRTNGQESLHSVPPVPEPSADQQDPDLDQSAEEIALAVIGMMRQFASMKSRVALGPESGDSSLLYLLVKLAHLGPTRASDLAEEMCADPSTVSRQVAALVKSRLVERQADPDDGRASILVPTELGLVKVREHSERRGAMLRPVIEDWSAPDRDNFVRLINKYTEGIEARRDQMISIMLEHHGKGA